ncbi:zinc finger protein [Loa loa]|uniref:Zinc finger protein n=1 Tax=Loa loa TaxID=7209 RepID=A0A1S0UD39_LOALO|nr:zinc finger protein [Loa loa]EJD73463.1 zinc finger protein [Loa loa]
MSITQIIGFSLLVCITLAYNETFSPFDLNTNVITTFVGYPGYEQNVTLNNYYQPTTLLPNNVYNPSELFKSSDSNENIDYDFFQKYIDNFNLSYFDPDPSEYNIDGEIPEEEQSHKRPHDRCDASLDNRDEYRKCKKTPDQPSICKRKRPDCGPTSNHSSFAFHNETHQTEHQGESCNRSFSF